MRLVALALACLLAGCISIYGLCPEGSHQYGLWPGFCTLNKEGR